MVKKIHIYLIRYIYLILFIFCGGFLFGQAPVDNPCNLPAPAGAEWPLDSTCHSMSTTGMTSLFDPGTCTSGARDDAWAWIAGDGNNITITYTPDSRNAILHVFSVSAPCSVTEVDCSDIGGNGVAETVAITPSVLGTVYFIRVQRDNSNNIMTGNLCVGSSIPPVGGGAGDDCASADRINCGDPVSAGETTIGLTDIEDDWACSTIPGANNYPGLDHFYVIQWPDAVNGGSIRLDFTNVADADATLFEVISLGSTCAPDACLNTSQLTIATGLFGVGGNTFIEFTVGPGLTDYYFVIDSQGDGVDDAIDTYDIQAICFATGVELDVNNNCAPIPVTAAANQGYYATWNGAEPPVTGDAATLAAGGPYTVCENIYIENPAGWEWLKDFDITLGDCWINVGGLTPSGTNNGFYNVLGDWTPTIGGGTPNVLNWNFANSSNATWGDGVTNAYSCNLYTFCYTADVDPGCIISTGLQNGVSASDDGIGGGGGGSVNPGNVTIGSTSPTVLPVSLLSFKARAILNEGKYDVVLNWRTSSEINNDYFTVEKSIDVTDFEEVFKASGAGNSNDINNYIGVDEDPYEGVSYYRLKQTDFDGNVEYFEIVSVDISNITNLKIYPNPVTSVLTLSLESKLENSNIKLSVYNAQGKLILNQNNILDKGINNIQLNMENYSQGMYFISIEHGSTLEYLKFSKQ
tara:strand:- start:19468 stop:21543 length:2076 start_codon:yes stop_codon:yes gene_type:complete